VSAIPNSSLRLSIVTAFSAVNLLIRHKPDTRMGGAKALVFSWGRLRIDFPVILPSSRRFPASPRRISAHPGASRRIFGAGLSSRADPRQHHWCDQTFGTFRMFQNFSNFFSRTSGISRISRCSRTSRISRSSRTSRSSFPMFRMFFSDVPDVLEVP